MISSNRQSATTDRSSRELRGVLAAIRFHSDSGFTIGALRSGEAVKGSLREPAIGLEYVFRGRWIDDPRYGWQFAFDEAGSMVPSTEAGVRDYLRAHAPWVGPEVARAMLEAFGVAAIEILKSDPDRVAEEIRGITPERASEIQAALLAVEGMERAEVALRGIVRPAGINARQLNAILKLYGSEAPDVVRANPYRLIDDVDGVGWVTADRIGAAVGIAPQAPARLRAGILHTLKSAEDDGHTCLSRATLGTEAAQLLRLGAAAVDDDVDDLIASEDLVSYEPESACGAPGARIYRASTFGAESSVARSIVRLLRPSPVKAGAP